MASASEQEQSKYNSLGQAIWSKDRNANEHSLNFDLLGRETEDIVSMLGVNVDGAVRRQVTEYDGQGNPFQLTSYDATTGGNITSQLSRVYNGLGQMTVEYQSHSGAVVTATTPKVQYAYSFAPAGTTNHSRLTSMTYPNGRVITYDYGTSAGLNDVISRLGEIKDGATSLESYSYLGEYTVVERNHAQPGVNLTYVKLTAETVADGGDQYTGLDRFGRIVDQRWRKTTELDRFSYTYDRNSNRTAENNLVIASSNEAYTYDGLDQLTGFSRNSTSRTQTFDYDAVGNFEGVTTKVGANPATTQTRTHNRQNEILTVSGATSPVFDANGNMTKDETGKQYVFDAWNRLKVVKDAGGVTLVTYNYDNENQRTQEVSTGSVRDFYYSNEWQVIEEKVGTSATTPGTTRVSYVWSPVYVDAMIARDRDADNNGSLEERLYPTHDANFNVTALVNTTGTVVERYAYDPFGTVTFQNASGTTIAASTLGWQYLHQGGRLNAASSLYSFRNREYSATLGRWVNMDPIRYEAGDVNLYRYVGNNGVNSLDPSGLDRFVTGGSANGNPFDHTQMYLPNYEIDPTTGEFIITGYTMYETLVNPTFSDGFYYYANNLVFVLPRANAHLESRVNVQLPENARRIPSTVCEDMATAHEFNGMVENGTSIPFHPHTANCHRFAHDNFGNTPIENPNVLIPFGVPVLTFVGTVVLEATPIGGTAVLTAGGASIGAATVTGGAIAATAVGGYMIGNAIGQTSIGGVTIHDRLANGMAWTLITLGSFF